MRLNAANRSLVAAVAFAAALLIAQSAGAATAYAVTTSNGLLTFSTSSPGTVTGPTAISGLPSGEAIVGIDIRPANQALYGFGNSGRLYVINRTTAAATVVSTVVSPFAGTLFGVDWEAASDHLRVVSDLDDNRRYAANGASVFTSPDVAYAVGDVNEGVDPSVSGAAYSASTLYDIDVTTDSLVIQDVDSGELTTVGALGPLLTEHAGFDVAGSVSGATAYAALITEDFAPNGPDQGLSSLYTVDLATGSADLVGMIGTGYEVRGLTVESSTRAGVATFGAVASRQGVVLHWRMDSAIGVLGFRPYRGVGGSRVPLTRNLIPASGRSAHRFVHRLARRTPGARYWLKVRHVDGSSTWHGPAVL